MRAVFFVIFFLLAALSFGGEVDYPLTIDLNEPEYLDGVISTDQGGVISSTDMRVQARKIIYTYKVSEGKQLHSVIAEGNLMLEKGKIVYTGKRLEYDFVTKTGVIYCGKTLIDFWFIGGKVIKMTPDRHFLIKHATLTTSENKSPYWTIESREMEVTDRFFLKAKGPTTVRLLDTPIFYLPPLPFTLNLKRSSNSVVSYGITQDTGLWPLLSLRYQIYSWKYLKLSLSLNVRTSKGIGGSVESEYFSENKKNQFLTRSYLDHDTFYRDSSPNKARAHYRFQGLYTAETVDKRSSLSAQYDYLSDKNLQSDFVTPGFVCETDKQTKLKFLHLEDWSIFALKSEIKINSFQTMKQELPKSFWTIKTLQIGDSGILSENRFSLSYLDYTFASRLKDPSDFHSMRLSSQNKLYRPFNCRGLTFTPIVGSTGIFYTNNRKNQAALQGVLHYGFDMDLKLKKRYATCSHIVYPYLSYQGLTSPTINPNDVYIFSIQDGYQRLNVLRSGIRQLFYLSRYPLFDPNIILDLYVYAFFGARTFNTTIPKIRAHLTWNFPSFSITGDFSYNHENHVFNYANIGIAWTLNEHCAFKSEFRHRSRFYWRKNNPDNFIMEVTRSIDELLASPLSDGRNTLVSRLQVKIAPQWIARVESHIGWGRQMGPSYNAIKVDLFTTISTSWQLHATLIHSPAPENKDTRFLFKLALGARPNLDEKLGSF